MMQVNFKTLIPNVVRDWIREKQFEDELLEAQVRLHRKLSTAPQFRATGTVQEVVIEKRSMIGNCSIVVVGNTEEEARQQFKEVFGDMAKRGQKFKMTGFETIKE
jgi:ABC-type phosphate/phosphonate transport system substrate-binding protein